MDVHDLHMDINVNMTDEQRKEALELLITHILHRLR